MITKQDVERMVCALKEPGASVDSAQKESNLSGFGLRSIRDAFKRYGYGAPSSYLSTLSDKRRQYVSQSQPIVTPNARLESGSLVARLAQLTRAKSRTVIELADALDVSPKRLKELVDSAKSQGYRVDFAGDSVAWREPEQRTHDVGIAQVQGTHCALVISDTHFGSKYCLREQLIDCVTRAYGMGARDVLHAGDILDGCYAHGRWELSHHGVDEQIQDAFDTLPQLDGLRYHAITGNHDETFTRDTGLDTGRAIEDRFRSLGRSDFRCYDARGATLRIGGVKVALWHPRPGKSYALSYQLQNYIRDLPIGAKPDILIAGHWHAWGLFEQRGVHALMGGTFQGGGSAFSKSLGGAPSIGGTLLRWGTTEHGTIRELDVKRFAYYEGERVRDV